MRTGSETKSNIENKEQQAKMKISIAYDGTITLVRNNAKQTDGSIGNESQNIFNHPSIRPILGLLAPIRVPFFLAIGQIKEASQVSKTISFPNFWVIQNLKNWEYFVSKIIEIQTLISQYSIQQLKINRYLIRSFNVGPFR